MTFGVSIGMSSPCSQTIRPSETTLAQQAGLCGNEVLRKRITDRFQREKGLDVVKSRLSTAKLHAAMAKPAAAKRA